MFAIVNNNQIQGIAQPDSPFTSNGTSYAPGFIRNASPQEKKDAGLMEIIYGPQPDQRFYWVSGPEYKINGEIVEATFSATPKQLEDEGEAKGLKSQWIAQTKAAANSQLAQTDWVVIRKAERGVEIPAEVAAERAEILAGCAAREAAIQASTTVEELVEALR